LGASGSIDGAKLLPCGGQTKVVDSMLAKGAETSTQGGASIEEEDEMYGELLADQVLSKGQRINIGRPDSYFRPVYATTAGVKTVQQDQEATRLQTRLQVISAPVLDDPDTIARMSDQMLPDGPLTIDAATAAAAIAGAVAAAQGSGKRAAHAVRFQDVIGPNPFKGVAESKKRQRVSSSALDAVDKTKTEEHYAMDVARAASPASDGASATPEPHDCAQCAHCCCLACGNGLLADVF
jgi:hypothetical protein